MLFSLLDEYDKEKESIRFIQVGSNDGVTNDPIHRFVALGDKWTGILIEPVKYIFNNMVDNYQNRSDLIFENVAISTSNTIMPFFRLDEALPNQPVWYNQIGSLHKEIVLKHNSDELPPTEQLLVEELVKTMTMGAMIDKHGFHDVNVLHIDSEGHDWEIIKTTPFHRLHDLDIVMFEHKHLSQKSHNSAIAFLRNFGYNYESSEVDTIAFRG